MGHQVGSPLERNSVLCSALLWPYQATSMDRRPNGLLVLTGQELVVFYLLLVYGLPVRVVVIIYYSYYYRSVNPKDPMREGNFTSQPSTVPGRRLQVTKRTVSASECVGGLVKVSLLRQHNRNRRRTLLSHDTASCWCCRWPIYCQVVGWWFETDNVIAVKTHTLLAWERESARHAHGIKVTSPRKNASIWNVHYLVN